MPPKTSVWLSPKDAGDRLGLTQARLRQLADDGTFKEAKTGRSFVRVSAGGHREYLWPEVREAYIQLKVDAAVASSMAAAPAPESKEAAQARLANAQADKVEYELAIKRQEYLSVAYHLREIEKMAGRLVAPLGALGAQYRDRSLGLTPETVDAFWAQVEDELRAQFREAVADVDDSDPAEEPPAEAA